MKGLTRSENRRMWLWTAAILLGLLALALAVWPRPAGKAPALAQRDPSLLAQAAVGLDDISVDLRFDPDIRPEVRAEQTLTLTNRTGVAQECVVLRSWTGAYLSQETSPAASAELFSLCYGDRFSTGGLLLDSAETVGQTLSYRWRDQARTVLELPLPEPWLPGGMVRLRLTWHCTVPKCASRFGVSQGWWALGNLFPIPAVWEDGRWREDPYETVGDPFYSECVNWSVTVTAPSGWTVAASAPAVVTEETGDRQSHAMRLEAARDFALLLTERAFCAEAAEGGVNVRAVAETREAADRMLQAALCGLRSFAYRWGPYVYPSLTVCEVDFPYGGMEYPGMEMISQETALREDGGLAYAVIHETAHQWWGVQVGSDSWRQPWQDESLCEWAAICCIGDWYGAARKNEAIEQLLRYAGLVRLPEGVTPGSAISAFSSTSEYSQAVYTRAATLWPELALALGEAELDQALRDYQTAYRFQNASREQLTRLLSEHAGRDLTALLEDLLDMTV